VRGVKAVAPPSAEFKRPNTRVHASLFISSRACNWGLPSRRGNRRCCARSPCPAALHVPVCAARRRQAKRTAAAGGQCHQVQQKGRTPRYFVQRAGWGSFRCAQTEPPPSEQSASALGAHSPRPWPRQQQWDSPAGRRTCVMLFTRLLCLLLVIRGRRSLRSRQAAGAADARS
jgi:hypothetical protein